MIFITDDTHADFSRLDEINFPLQNEMTKDDYVIICGDFGGVWNFEEESHREKENLDWLNSKNFTTLFIDGNHENYTRLYNDYTVIEWHGGKVHKIRDFSWWDLELPTDEEMQNGIKNLEKHNYKVDYIITHCCPTNVQPLINLSYKTDYLTDYLQTIAEKCNFKKWFFGHYHENKHINPQYTLLYESIEPIEYRSGF